MNSLNLLVKPTTAAEKMFGMKFSIYNLMERSAQISQEILDMRLMYIFPLFNQFLLRAYEENLRAIILILRDLPQWFRKSCHLKIFTFLALMTILFSGTALSNFGRGYLC